jgi:hypothetical protein
VLEVVEQQQQPLVLQMLAQQLPRRPHTPVADGQRLRDGGQDDAIGEGGKVDEPDAVRKLLQQVGGELQRQAGLAGAARPGQRQQTHLAAAEQRPRPRQLPRTADERRRLHRQVRRPVLERPRRRELRAQTTRQQLVDPLRLREVLQPVLAQVAQRQLGQRRLVQQLARRLREQHLTTVGSRPDAGGAMHVEPHVIVGRKRRSPGVDAHPHPHARRAGPDLPLHRALRLRSSVHRVLGAPEHHEERVALGRDLDAPI